MHKHVSLEPPRPSTLRPDLPEYLDKVVLACLAKRPERRPASALELYSALVRVAV
jgi:serine/threonine-protein kinase